VVGPEEKGKRGKNGVINETGISRTVWKKQLTEKEEDSPSEPSIIKRPFGQNGRPLVGRKN